MKNLRVGFSMFGFIIAALQLLPNILWALFPPAVNRLEGNASSIPFIEYGEHVLGVAIVVLLMFLTNRTQKKKMPYGPLFLVSLSTVGLYWLCWILYYCAFQPLPVIYAMVILPPAAFFFAGAAEKVYPISVASILFVTFHLAVAFENFPL